MERKFLQWMVVLMVFLLIGISWLIPLANSSSSSSSLTPTPSSLLENIRIVRRYPLEVEGKVLEENPWGEYYAPKFSPDGRWMLFTKPVIGGRELWLTDSRGKNPQRLLEKVWDYAWSPDGKRIAYTQSLPEPQKGASLWVMKFDGTGKRKLAEPLKSGKVEWTNDEKLVYLAADGSIMSISLDGKQAYLLVSPLISEAFLFSISPDGHHLALASKPDLWLIDLEKPWEPRKLNPYVGAYSGIRGGLAWSPDSQRLAFASYFGIYYITARDGDLTRVETAWYPHDFAWSPDGRILAFIGRTEQRGFDYEIYLLDVERGQVKQLTNDQENMRGGEKSTLTWSPDGDRLIYGTSRLPGQKVQVIEITYGPKATKPEERFPGKGGTNAIPFVPTSSEIYTPALSDCPYQEGNNGTIWIYREWFCPYERREDCIRQIPFEIGIYQEDPSWSNYLGGVLEGEIGGSIETPLENWQSEMARAFSIAARTVALYWCPHSILNINGITHYGLDDHTYQVYRPGWSPSRAEEYREFVADTEGQYLTHGGNVFDLQYRKYVGQQTYNRDPNGPHKGIFDPVDLIGNNG